MSTLERPPLVLIEWEDSAQPVAAWQLVADLDEPEIVRCVSVGFLIHDGESVKALAPNMGDVGESNEQISGLIRIPTRCVVRVARLVEVENAAVRSDGLSAEVA